ncbi:Crp/Fnr family transcriptional regulator [Solitalea sp. MAHUQ-68]|uniref:Crp/Fnr family transcriptional regulator n=1 Tax=Solitalea agri TaxID=2953739 RepID=A0A9X2F292_9SPHI|nr:Crp/Fnr family transcriptional regulator [Solitalea agri]
MKLEDILRSIYDLRDASLNKLIERISPARFPKGHRLFNTGKIETDLYFISKGMARAFLNTEAHEITFWFGKEGDTVLSYNSYIHNKPGYETIELLEDSELYRLKTVDLMELYNEDIHISNWGRKLAEYELVKTEERLISRQFKTAIERYKELIERQPELIQRVQLGYIASYLGVSQVTLSRIRAEIK